MTQETANPNPEPAKRKLPVQAVVFVLVGLLGFVFYALYYKQVFPSASIEMKLSQKEAAKKSESLAASLGYDVGHAKKVTTFKVDYDAKTVLEFKLGIAKANQLMKEQVPVWFWRTRFCKELSEDELIISWTTQGTFNSMFHTFENDKKLPTISQDDALALARKFVTETAGIDLSHYELFDRGSETKPNRTDHHFVWRRAGYSESEFRIRVEVAGNQVATCRYWLAPTGTWDREYENIRHWNDCLDKIASFHLGYFIVTAIGAFVYGMAKHQIRWRFTLIASGVVTVLMFLGILNQTNDILEQYPTSMDYRLFLATRLLAAVVLSLAAFAASVLIVGGAEVVYRKTRPAQTAMQHLFTLPAMAQKSWIRKAVIGHLLVGAMMFWVISYYKIGERFGFFCPLGVDYQALSTFCPAISGALTGVIAAGLEELSCRVVGLGLLQQWTKSFWLANFLQAVVWGFAHSGYAQEPCYVRGIELTVVGLFFGYIVRNYGILPCIVAHYLYDAFLTVEPVFVSHRVLLIVPSILVLLPFVAGVWLARRWSKKQPVDVEALDLTNAHELELSVSGPEHPKDKVEELPPYTALTKARRQQLVVVTAVCLAMCFVPTRQEIGSNKQVSVSAATATGMAAKYLTAQGYDHKDYVSVAQLLVQPGSDTESKLMWQHIYEKVGLDRCREIYQQSEPGLEWLVSFFKPLEPRNYKLHLNGDGSLRSIAIYDLDEAPGANVDESKALAIAQAYLKRYRPDLTPFELDSKTKIVQAKRIDYKFDFLVPKLAAADTPAVAHVELKGDKISTVSVEWRVPDTWSWLRTKQQWYRQAIGILRFVILIPLTIALMVWSVHLLRTTRVPWRLALSVGLLLSAIAIVGLVNSAIGASIDLPTTDCLLSAIGCTFGSLVAFSALQNVFPQITQQLHKWVLLRPSTAEQRRVRSDIWIDAAISSYALTSVVAALTVIEQLTSALVSPRVPLNIPDTIAAIYSSSVPFLQVLVIIVGWTLGAPLAVILCASSWRRFIKTRVLSTIVIVTAAVLLGSDSRYWQVCLTQSFFCLLELIVGRYFVRNVLAENSLSYVFTALITVSAFYLSELLFHTARIGNFEIGMLVAYLVAPALLTVIFYQQDKAACRA